MSRHNFIGGSSGTGGTGALTLSAVDGLALPASAFIDGQFIEYSIQEFTDSTRSTLARAETGFGAVSSSNVLTRSAPRTTWDGTTYLQDSPSALSFGTSNVLAFVSPIAEGGPTAFGSRANFNSVYGSGPNEWNYGANLAEFTDYTTSTPAVNSLWMVPVKVETGYPIASLGVAVTTLAASGSMNVAIASCRGDTGLPGQILLSANGLATTSTGIVSSTMSGRLLAPGWYWALFNSGTAAAAIRGANNCLPSPMGGLVASSRTVRYVTRSRTYADFTVGDDALSGSSGSVTSVANLAAPLLLWR